MNESGNPTKKYVMLRKTFAGLTLVCFLVFVIGQAVVGVSAESMVLWSSLLVWVIGVSAQIVVRLWHSWEEVQDDTAAMGPKEDDFK